MSDSNKDIDVLNDTVRHLRMQFDKQEHGKMLLKHIEEAVEPLVKEYAEQAFKQVWENNRYGLEAKFTKEWEANNKEHFESEVHERQLWVSKYLPVLTKEEEKAIDNYIKENHEPSGVSGGQFSLKVTFTSIGDIVDIYGGKEPLTIRDLV